MRRPQFIARQASRPQGLLGRLIAAIMVRETASINRAVIAALEVRPADHLLDVGCGSGFSIELLVPLVPQGSVSGIDPSALMTARACKRNCPDVTAGRVIIATAGAEHIPFVDDTFDAIMSVHTVYFWMDLDPALAELARVLRPGGRLVLAFRTSGNAAAAASFPHEVYCIRSLEQIVNAVGAAGFCVIATKPDRDGGEPALLLAQMPEATAP